MKALLSHISNPFELSKRLHSTEINSKITINQGIRKLYSNFKGFEKPTILFSK